MLFCFSYKEKKFNKIKAIKDRILLIKDTITETAAGIILLSKEGHNIPPYTGIIISIGDAVEDEDYVEGMRVLFHDLAGTGVEYDGTKYYNIRERDIVAIVEKNITIE